MEIYCGMLKNATTRWTVLEVVLENITCNNMKTLYIDHLLRENKVLLLKYII